MRTILIALALIVALGTQAWTAEFFILDPFGVKDVHVSEIEWGPHGCWDVNGETDMWRCP